MFALAQHFRELNPLAGRIAFTIWEPGNVFGSISGQELVRLCGQIFIYHTRNLLQLNELIKYIMTWVCVEFQRFHWQLKDENLIYLQQWRFQFGSIGKHWIVVDPVIANWSNSFSNKS
jgi:hypothetical protein